MKDSLLENDEGWLQSGMIFILHRDAVRVANL